MHLRPAATLLRPAARQPRLSLHLPRLPAGRRTLRERFHTATRVPGLSAAVAHSPGLRNPAVSDLFSQLRYDLSKWRGKGLLVRQPGTQWYQFTSEGYRLAILYLKLYERLYAPLTAAICAPDP